MRPCRVPTPEVAERSVRWKYMIAAQIKDGGNNNLWRLFLIEMHRNDMVTI